MISLEEAIETVIARTKADPNFSGDDSFESVEALRRACDPDQRPAMGVAHNRAAVRHYVATGVWQSTRESAEAEAKLLEAAGYKVKRGCRGGSCSI